MSDPIKEYGQRVAEAVRAKIIDCYQGHVSHRKEVELEMLAINLVPIVEVVQQAESVARDVLMQVAKSVEMELITRGYVALTESQLSEIVNRYAAQPPTVAMQTGYCAEGDHCNCGGDLPRIREGCANWRKGNTAVTVPNGYVLVPVVPTQEMLDAAARASMQHLIDCIADPDKAKGVGSEEMTRLTHASRYVAMLAAAQKDPRQAFEEYHLGKPFSLPAAAQEGGTA